MKRKTLFTTTVFALMGLSLMSCQPSAIQEEPTMLVAAESFLADITQNVAGDRLTVEALIPAGLDPHAFEPTPHDAARITRSRALVINGAGLEEWLNETLAIADSETFLIEASAGLKSRQLQEGEPVESEAQREEEQPGETSHPDPHFWLDPILVIRYVENLRDGLSQIDPEGKTAYARNAEAYIQKLGELDDWIKGQVAQIPPERRLLVTNHASFGYFADRYGFRLVGTVIPSVSTGASPSAQELAALAERMHITGAPAIFLETGANTKMAEQVAQETGAKVVTNLYSHSLTPSEGEAPTYLDMMKHNVLLIVEALK